MSKDESLLFWQNRFVKLWQLFKSRVVRLLFPQFKLVKLRHMLMSKEESLLPLHCKMVKLEQSWTLSDVRLLPAQDRPISSEHPVKSRVVKLLSWQSKLVRLAQLEQSSLSVSLFSQQLSDVIFSALGGNMSFEILLYPHAKPVSCVFLLKSNSVKELLSHDRLCKFVKCSIPSSDAMDRPVKVKYVTFSISDWDISLSLFWS